MKSNNIEQKAIKLPGLVTQDYCILASLPQTSLQNGTVWTNKDSTVTTVISKNHQRLTDEKTLISIQMSPGNAEMSVETTATSMFEVTSAGDRYLTTYIVKFKDFSNNGGEEWSATVFGNPGLDEAIKTSIDPYVALTKYQFFMSARFNDVVKDHAGNGNVTEKTYTKLSQDLYSNTILTTKSTFTNSQTFSSDDMFRTLASDDFYTDESGDWRVKEKQVFYLATIGGIDFYGRELLLIKA